MKKPKKPYKIYGIEYTEVVKNLSYVKARSKKEAKKKLMNSQIIETTIIGDLNHNSETKITCIEEV